MGVIHNFGVIAFKNLTRLICRVDDSQLEMVPIRGPLILIVNHVHIMELPVIYTHLQPRPLTSLVAAKRWKRIWTRVIVEQVGAVPLHRGTADVGAMRRGIDALREGKIILMSPEGTRSGDGRLQRGKPGIVLLALHGNAPIVPMVHYGSEDYLRNLSRLRRSDFHLVVGESFRLRSQAENVNRQMRRQMTDEIMYRMASILPPEYRGVYSDLNKATTRFIEFAPQ